VSISLAVYFQQNIK